MREQGVIDPVDVANRIAERLAAFSKTELVAFISPLLAESVRNVYSRERLDLPKKVHAAKMSGKVQIIRDAYGKVIGLPSGEWKAIGDCNRLELLDYSAMLHGMARQTERKPNGMSGWPNDYPMMWSRFVRPNLTWTKPHNTDLARPKSGR